MRLKRPAKLNVGIDRDRAAIEKAMPPDSAEWSGGALQRADIGASGPAMRTGAKNPAIPAGHSQESEEDRHGEKRAKVAECPTCGYLARVRHGRIARHDDRRHEKTGMCPGYGALLSDSAIADPLVKIFTSPSVPVQPPEAGCLDPRNREAGSHFTFQQGDAISYLEYSLSYLKTFGRWAYDGRALIYCDPPYMRHTCASRCRYKYDLSDLEHRRLLRVLQDLNTLPDPPMLMISGYDSELYREMLSGFHHTDFQAMTRCGKQATEHLWFNFPSPTVLHDSRYVGKNWRDRERIKRRQQTWIKTLKTMQPYEREALLAAIGSLSPEHRD